MRIFKLSVCIFPLLAACGGGGGDSPAGATPGPTLETPKSKLALKNFESSCTDFLSYAADALTEQFLAPIACLAFGPCPVFAGAESPAPPSAGTGSDASAPTRGTLSIPLQSYNSGNGNGFAGFLVLRVEPAAATALREIGRIAHTGFAQPSGGGGCSGGSTGGPSGSSAPCRDAVYAADPRRSLFMQDAQGTYLYTLSSLGIIASSASAPGTELGRKPLALDDQSCCFVTPQPAGLSIRR